MTMPAYIDASSQYLQAILSGDRRRGLKIVKRLLQHNIRLDDLYEHVIRKALYQVGILWENNRITVAEEHLATSVSEAVMNELFSDIVASERKPLRALLGCAENEYHQIGIRMVSDIFEARGWDSLFLGAGIPVNELIRYAKEATPDLIALSVSIYFNIPVIETMLREIRKEFHTTPVLIGGQAFRHGGEELAGKFGNTTYIPDLYALETYIDQYERSRHRHTD